MDLGLGFRIMVKLGFFSKPFFFVIYIFFKSTHLFFGAWSFLLVHIRFTPIKGPKDFVN